MKKKLVLKENKAFKRAYFRGKFKAHPLLVTYVVKNKLGKMRVGITTSKKVGNAVTRSRARRVLRSAYDAQLAKGFTANGYDIVFVARAATAAVKSYDAARVMKKQLQFLFSDKSSGKEHAAR